MEIIPITNEHNAFIRKMLYLAFFVPEGTAPFPHSIIDRADILKYHQGWGKKGDVGFLAKVGEKYIGATWSRLHRRPNEGYGFVNDETPELNIALLAAYRGQGIGTQLMHTLLTSLFHEGYPGLSLSVDQRNTVALQLYRKLGFELIKEEGTAITMLKKF
ncbi:MAG: N-acetyltransferase [Saprospiraceae bacterium]